MDRERSTTTSTSPARSPKTAEASQLVQRGPSASATAQSNELSAMMPEDRVDVQRRVLLGVNPNEVEAPAPMASQVDDARSTGQTLDEGTRTQMESSFGVDFSGVRVHTDARADRLNQDVKAEAFTTGQDIFFRQGTYAPGSSDGQKLLAHELTHVIQQRGTARRGEATLGNPDGHAEREAEAVSSAVAERSEGARAEASAISAAGQGELQRRLWIGAVIANRRLTTPGRLVTPSNASPEGMTKLLEQGSAQVAPAAAWPAVEQAISRAIGTNPALLNRPDLINVCRTKFDQWVSQVSSFENIAANQAGTPTAALGTAEDRVYFTEDDLALALIGETDPRMLQRLDVERQLAATVATRSDIIGELDTLLTGLATNLSNNDKAIIAGTATRYGQFSSIPACAQILASPGGASMVQKVILIDEISEHLRGGRLEASAAFNALYQGTPNFNRLNGFTLDENQQWVKDARSLGLPIQAGPSGTASRFCAMAVQQGMGGQQLYKICWALFAFYNGMFAGFTGTHRLHEVMSACERYVPISQYGYTPDITQI